MAWMRRPFATPDKLYAVMVEEVERAPLDKQLALLRAHLGTRARMSAASTGEQASGGLEPDGSLERYLRNHQTFRPREEHHVPSECAGVPRVQLRKWRSMATFLFGWNPKK
jgi:hypothetical protein